MEIKTWLQTHCKIPMPELESVADRMEACAIYTTDSLLEVLENYQGLLSDHRMHLPVYYAVKISQELQKLYYKQLQELNTSEMCLALKNSNFSRTVLTAVESHELNGRKIVHVDDNNWIQDFLVDKYEVCALKETVQKWKQCGISKTLFQQSNECVNDNIIVDSELLEIYSPFSTIDKEVTSPPCITAEMAEVIASDIVVECEMKERIGSSEEDTSGSTDSSSMSLSSNSVLVSANPSSLASPLPSPAPLVPFVTPAILINNNQQQAKLQQPQKKRKAVKTKKITNEMTMTHMKIVLDPSLPSQHKLEAISFLVQGINQVNGEEYVRKIFTDELIQILLNILTTSTTTKEVLEQVILLVDNIIAWGDKIKVRDMLHRSNLPSIVMKGLYSSYTCYKYQCLHTIQNIVICYDDILLLLLQQELLPLLDDVFDNLSNETMDNLETLSLTLRHIFHTMINTHIPILLEHVEPIMLLMEKLIVQNHYQIQYNLLETLKYQCESEDNIIYTRIVTSSIIMNTLLTILHGNKIRLINNAFRIVADLSSSSHKDSLNQLLQYGAEGGSVSLWEILVKYIHIPRSSRYITAHYECYRIITELCMQDEVIIQQIINKKIYKVLITNLEEYFSDPILLQPPKGIVANIKLNNVWDNYIELNCIAITSAVIGANEQQIQYFLSKGLLHLFHMILTYRSDQMKVIKEVLTAIECLLTNYNPVNIIKAASPSNDMKQKDHHYHHTSTASTASSTEIVNYEMIVEELSRKEYTTIHHLVMHGKDPGIVELAKTIKHLLDQAAQSDDHN